MRQRASRIGEQHLVAVAGCLLHTKLSQSADPPPPRAGLSPVSDPAPCIPPPPSDPRNLPGHGTDLLSPFLRERACVRARSTHTGVAVLLLVFPFPPD